MFHSSPRSLVNVNETLVDIGVSFFQQVYISEKEYMAYSDEMRLTTSGLINISEERNKYYETGKCDFHSIIYNLFCKYLDNPNYIKDTITAASAVSF